MQVWPPESRECGGTFKASATRAMAPLDLRSWRGATALLASVVSFFSVAFTQGRALRECARRACACARLEVLLSSGGVGLSQVILWPPFDVHFRGGTQ